MMQSRIYLNVPSENQLDYRIKLLANADTMGYNRGSGDDGSGCYNLTYEQTRNWYKNWLSDPKKYYAYLVRKEDEVPVGEVNIHYDEKYLMHMVGIIIEAHYRGNGYAEEGLRLLAEKAFYNMGLDRIADTFLAERIEAEKVFRRVGFVRLSDELLVLTKDDYESTRGGE